MAAVTNFSCRHSEIRPALRSDNGFILTSVYDHRPARLKISRSFREASNHSRKTRCPRIRMTIVDDKLVDIRTIVKPADILAYDLVQGADVRWSYIMGKRVPEPPTAILLHGILGSRKNWGTFARRLAKEFPKWQFLLVDLRCHGDSASLKKRGPHTVASAALDVLKLLCYPAIARRFTVHARHLYLFTL